MAIDFKGSLDSLLQAYTQVTQVRATADVAKYNAAAQAQQAMFSSPVGYTSSEAYATGNARPTSAVPVGASASMQIPKELIYGGLGLAALGLAWKVFK